MSSLKPAAELASRGEQAVPERQCRVPEGAHRACSPRDRTATPHRAGGPATPRAAAGRPARRITRFEDENGKTVSLADSVRSHDTLVTYFWCWAAARATLPDVHGVPGVDRFPARDITQRVAGRAGPVARGTTVRLRARARLEESGFFATVGDDFARDYPASWRPGGTSVPAFDVWVKRDGMVLTTGPPESAPRPTRARTARRPGSHTAVEHPRPHPGGARQDWYPKLEYPQAR